jgi:hypothetical protein
MKEPVEVVLERDLDIRFPRVKYQKYRSTRSTFLPFQELIILRYLDYMSMQILPSD